MTVAHDVPRLVVETPAQAIRALRDAGLRLSAARRLVIDALFGADGPVTAVELARDLSLDESSVYRNLDVLERHGVTRHVHLGHSPGLYVLAGRGDTEYLYCDRCEKVTELAPYELEQIRAEIQERLGHTPRFTHFAMIGRCADCGGD